MKDYKKLYEGALERAKYWAEGKCVEDFDDSPQNVLDFVFPEAKEGEDEKIKNEIVDYLKSFIPHHDCELVAKSKEWIAWLEKQGEKTNPYSGISFEYSGHTWGMCARDGGVEILINSNPKAFVSVDKTEMYPLILNKTAPKFKVGDCIRHKGSDESYKIVTTDDNYYFCENNHAWAIRSQDYFELVDQKSTDTPKFKIDDWVINEHRFVMKIVDVQDSHYVYMYKEEELSATIEQMERSCHLWTIQDAKDGDVLIYEDGWTCIFKALVNDENFSSHCFMDRTKWFHLGSGYHTLKEEFAKTYGYGKLYPATKEQSDLLFQKMKEAGYEWDVEKKELKKIEKSDSAWNEKDESFRIDAIKYLEIFDAQVIHGDKAVPVINWLKSLKERVQPTIRPNN